jgi:hypothetical protein
MFCLGKEVFIYANGYAFGFLPHQIYGLDKGGLLNVYRPISRFEYSKY